MYKVENDRRRHTVEEITLWRLRRKLSFRHPLSSQNMERLVATFILSRRSQFVAASSNKTFEIRFVFFYRNETKRPNFSIFFFAVGSEA